MKVKRIAVLIGVLAFSPGVWSDGVLRPSFQETPARYSARYQMGTVANGDVEVENEFLVGNRSSHSLEFWLNVYGANGHTCSMAGEATALNGETFEVHRQECKLRITFPDAETAVVEESGGICRSSCGSRASVGRRELKRAPVPSNHRFHPTRFARRAAGEVKRWTS